MNFLKMRIINVVLIMFNLLTSCHSQVLNMGSITSNKSYSCKGIQSCCEVGIELGEMAIEVLFIDVKLKKNQLYLKGKVLTELNSLTIILGEESDNKICPINIVDTIDSGENTFEINISISNTSILYFQSLSFQPKVYHVGRLFY
jgi:hypothetical protein